MQSLGLFWSVSEHQTSSVLQLQLFQIQTVPYLQTFVVHQTFVSDAHEERVSQNCPQSFCTDCSYMFTRGGCPYMYLMAFTWRHMYCRPMYSLTITTAAIHNKRPLKQTGFKPTIHIVNNGGMQLSAFNQVLYFSANSRYFCCTLVLSSNSSLRQISYFLLYYICLTVLVTCYFFSLQFFKPFLSSENHTPPNLVILLQNFPP